MDSKRLNLVDTAWLNVETERAPMHVGGLLTFRMPDGAPADLPRRIVEHYHAFTKAQPPWNHRLRSGRLSNVAPEWELLDEIDVEYHFRHSALPAPGGEVALGELASRLHSHPLDFRRPPWEAHLIEGLEGNRFAMYVKVHHSLIDGVAGMRLLARALTDDATDMERPPFWAIEPKKRRRRSPDEVRPGLYRAVAELVGEARDQVSSLPGFGGIVRDMLNAARHKGGAVGLPFSSASSILNGRIETQRRYATQLYSLSEFKALAKNAEVTVNDIVLAICGGGLRKYLRDIGELPSKPLTAGIPVSVRPADDDEEAGNALTFIVANLATDIEDPVERLAAVAKSTSHAKKNLGKLSAAAITQYTVALMAPYVLSLVSGMAGRTRPVFNVTVSNLPGPEGPLFIQGAEMEAFYPTSLVTHGQALNITVHGYADTLGFGFMGCRETLPSLQRLAVFTGEALDELRALYGDEKPSAKSSKSTAKRSKSA